MGKDLGMQVNYYKSWSLLSLAPGRGLGMQGKKISVHASCNLAEVQGQAVEEGCQGALTFRRLFFIIFFILLMLTKSKINLKTLASIADMTFQAGF